MADKEQQLQQLAQLQDYKDRAYEIEIELEAAALKRRKEQVQQETAQIKLQTRDQWKLNNQENEVQHSAFITAARRTVLLQTDGVMQKVRENGLKKAFNKIQEEPSMYKQFICQLIIQGVQLLHCDCNIICNKNDDSVVTSLMSDVKSKTSKEIKLSSTKLEGAERGVLIQSADGKITVQSTITQRVNQLMRTLAPDISSIALPDMDLIE